MRFCFALGLMTSLAFLTLGTSKGHAQPLVTGSLSAYYNFDSIDEDGFWLDGSGNNLHAFTVLGEGGDANDDGLDDIRLDTSEGNSVRGGASAWFDTDPLVKEDYIAICDGLREYPEGCDIAMDNNLIPVNAFTMAAWVKMEDVGQDQSVYQPRSEGGGFTHTQVNNGGRFRGTIRNDSGQDIVSWTQPDGAGTVPYEEWFHFVVSYDKGPDPEEPGTFAFYLNGEELDTGKGGIADGPVATDPTELGQLGNWGQGAYIGLVPDYNRQLVGHIDEFYLFTRKITAEEVQTLYNLEGGGMRGDFNGDNVLNAADIDDLTAQSASGTNPAAYDLNSDGLVNADDVKEWIRADDIYYSWVGDANLDKVFDTNDLIDVLAAATYEVDVDAVWSTGDFNGNGRFASGDLIDALADGGYELGVRTDVASVPEPSALVLLTLGALFSVRGLRRRS